MQYTPGPHGGIEVDLTHGSHRPLRVEGRTPVPNDNRDKVKTLDDLALSTLTLEEFPAVGAWRKRLFDPEWIPEICDELPRLLTEYYRSHVGAGATNPGHRAKALAHVFSHKKAFVSKDDLLPGQTTTSFVGPVVHVDTIGYCIWPELKTVSTRKQNPFKISPVVAARLDREIFPYWLVNRKAVQEVARYSEYDTAAYADDGRDRVDGGRFNGGPSIDPLLKKRGGETPKAQALMERVAFYLSDKATCVSHTVPDFDRVVKHGMNGLIAQMEADIAGEAAVGPEQQEFLRGVITVFEGAKTYAANLAEEAERAGNAELAEICRRVPAEPARTFHEALTCVWICYHLLLQENTNFGFSIGRLDQTLNPYYLRDWLALESDKARQDYTRRAVELMCHFFLRCSDHVPLSTEGAEILFAGSGSNQALTVGGTKIEDGRIVDAVNDMTYIILKATELLAIRDPNVHARYHKEIHHRDAAGNPLSDGEIDPYLRRICQVNIVTRATPAIHGDAPVIRSMSDYYRRHDGVSHDEALADAHDYASIGCIEQNANAKHYGNTGSTLFVLPAVLELAIYGGKHRSNGVDGKAPNLIHDKQGYTSKRLIKMKSMEEFIEAFRFQLGELACCAVQNNNYLGRFTERERPVPFLSGLFCGPTNLPGENKATFRDLSAGGAKYNSSGVAVIGLADVIDSFCVLDALVFGNRSISAKELLAAMDSQFKVEEEEEESHGFLSSLLSRVWGAFRRDRKTKISKRRMDEINLAIQRAPKYGAGVKTEGIYDNSTAVKYTHLLTKMIQDVFFEYRTHRGGRYLPGYWSMTNHAGFGMLTKATPNGRKAGEPFASGITPCADIVKRNGDTVGILDHMLSVAEVDGDTVTNGYTYNLSLTTGGPDRFSEDTELFAKYMRTFMTEDGVLVQLCVSSIADLKAADKAATAAGAEGAGEAELAALTPYKDLMIRVAGYSAYFVTLSKQMRSEIIARANFAIADGVEQHG